MFGVEINIELTPTEDQRRATRSRADEQMLIQTKRIQTLRKKMRYCIYDIDKY